MKQKIISTLGLTIVFSLLLFINGCKKNDVQPQTINPVEKKEVQTIKPTVSETISKINLWMDKRIAVAANQISTGRTLPDIIQSVKDNLDFSNLRYEELRDGEILVIVPIGKNFKSLNNQGKNPINVLLFILDKTGNIRKGNIIQYLPINTQTTSIPVNTFYNFYHFKKLEGDGKITFLNITDDFLEEYKIVNGKIFSFSMIQTKPKNNGRTEMACTNYWLVTTWADGTEDWQFLYQDCSETPCVLNRVINGRVLRTACSGGVGGETETAATQQVQWVVAQQVDNLWRVISTERISGTKKASAPGGGYFTGITHLSDILDATSTDSWVRAGVTVSYSPTTATSTVSGRITFSSGAQVFIPNTPNSWSFSQVFP